MAKLTFVINDEPEVTIPLEGLVTLGRDEDNDVVIEDDRISRHHAVLVCHDDGRVEIRDMGSTAGTLINDEPIRSHIYSKGDRLAFGPLVAQLDLEFSDTPTASNTEEKQLADLKESIGELSQLHDDKLAAIEKIKTTLSSAQWEIQSLADQQTQEQSRLHQLRQNCEREEQSLSELRRQIAEGEERNRRTQAQAEKIEEHVHAVTLKLAQLTEEQQVADETLRRVQREVDAQEIALQNASSEESIARGQLVILASREEELRTTLEELGPCVEKARDELRGIEARLTPLRNWKASMDQRYERLGSLAKDSEEESDLWREIEEAQAALFDLLPAARIPTHRLTRVDFPRISSRSGVPLKSERIRRSG